MEDYDYHCFCYLTYINPSSLIEEGNNWEILAALQKEKSLLELKELGIIYTDKQIEVLKALNFIVLQNNKYKSAVTILDKDDLQKLRFRSKKISTEILPIIQDDFILFSDLLKEKGLENNIYSIFFSYVMDNIVWRMFESNNILPVRDINVENPIWDGTVWFTGSKRKFSCGTNTVKHDGLALATNWSEIYETSVKSRKDYKTILSDIKLNGHITNKDLIDDLMKYCFCEPNGELKIPYIKKTDDTFIKYCEDIAAKIYDYLVNKVDFKEINETFNIQSKGDAIIIIYHDIMWDILETMEENGLLNKPKAFSNPESGKIADMKDLMFIYEE